MDLIRTCFRFVPYKGKLYCFSSSGFDVYKISDWALETTASLAATCGAVNDYGIWLGTENDGVYLYPHGYVGDISHRGVRRYAADTSPVVIADSVYSLDASGQQLMIGHRDGMTFLTSLTEAYEYPDSGGCSFVGLSDRYLAFEREGDLAIVGSPANPDGFDVDLVNPGAETGDTTGWTDETGGLAVRSTNPAPHGGSYYFYGGVSAETIAVQRVDLTEYTTTAILNSGLFEVLLSWMQASYNENDQVSVGVRFLDESQTLISSSMSTLQSAAALVWEEENHSADIPTGTRYIDVVLRMYRNDGTNCDGYVDDLTVAVGAKDLSVPSFETEFELINPGAEEDMTGWTIDQGDPLALASIPYSGSKCWWGSDSGQSPGVCHQAVDLTEYFSEELLDSGGVTLTVKWWQSAANNDDKAGMGFDFRNSAGTQISQSLSTIIWVKPYAQRTHAVAVPSGTRVVRVVMRFELMSGTYLDATIDDITLFAEVTNIVPSVARWSGNSLFLGSPEGLFCLADGIMTPLILSTDSNVVEIHPCPGATSSSGSVAYAVNDGVGGGKFAVLDLSASPVSDLVSVSGDASGVWAADDLSCAAYNGTLELYAWPQNISPAPQANNVRRDWSLYAEITDTLDGIAAGTVILTINGAAVTPTLTAITNGYRVEYAPASPSGYSSRVTVELSAEDTNGNTVSRSWYFTTVGPPAATITDAPPPNVVCIRDIGLTSAEADETIDSVNVVWLDDITGSLIITEDQAEAIGKVAIDEATYHRHIRTIQILEEDITGADPRDLQQGKIVTLTCPAIGMTDKKCEILAIQRRIAKGSETTWKLKIGYYEAVT